LEKTNATNEGDHRICLQKGGAHRCGKKDRKKTRSEKKGPMQIRKTLERREPASRFASPSQPSTGSQEAKLKRKKKSRIKFHPGLNKRAQLLLEVRNGKSLGVH